MRHQHADASHSVLLRARSERRREEDTGDAANESPPIHNRTESPRHRIGVQGFYASGRASPELANDRFWAEKHRSTTAMERNALRPELAALGLIIDGLSPTRCCLSWREKQTFAHFVERPSLCKNGCKYGELNDVRHT
jgi:hypothetical protein